MLDELALVTPLETGGERVLQRLEVTPPGGALVLVSGTPDGPTSARAAALRRRFSLVLLVLVYEGAPARVERRSGLVILTALPTTR